MLYNKLVRDRIPEIIASKGQEARIHVADEVEYWVKLKEKVLEEWYEFEAAENMEELADLFEVLQAVLAYKGFDPQEVEKIRLKKATERGGFEKRIILEET